jgi:hypothetical protein
VLRESIIIPGLCRRIEAHDRCSGEIQPSDVLIIDGSRYHGVAPLRSLPSTQFKSQPLRHSLVHFTRSMHMERGSGRGEGRYWAEPEGGLQRTRLRTTEKAGPL